MNSQTILSMYIFKSKGRTTTASSLRDSSESMCPNEVRLPEKLNRNPTSNMEEQDLKMTRLKGGFFADAGQKLYLVFL